MEIFSKKTVPAFMIAFLIPAIIAGCGQNTIMNLERIAHAMGVAYQIQDDIADFPAKDGLIGGVNYISALYLDRLKNKRDGNLQEINTAILQNQSLYAELNNEACIMFEQYKEKVFAGLSDIREYRLKSILNALVYKILKISV